MTETLSLVPSGWITPLALVLAVASTALTGGLFRPGPWYCTLRKPIWTPPDGIFPVVWPILYLAMTIAAWLVAISGTAWAIPALALWTWQLVLNALWSPVVFGLRRLGAGLVVILAFWIALAATTAAFFAASVWAGALMVPYLAWVTFATALNTALWWLNRGATMSSPASSM